MITPQHLVDLINNDRELLSDLQNKDDVMVALLSALNAAFNECATTSNLTHDKDAFFEANKLYIATVGIYIELLNDAVEKLSTPGHKYDEDFVGRSTAIFIALLAKLFRSARTITKPEQLVEYMPVTMWIEHIKPLYDEQIDEQPIKKED